jgi:hypothetical protein
MEKVNGVEIREGYSCRSNIFRDYRLGGELLRYRLESMCEYAKEVATVAFDKHFYLGMCGWIFPFCKADDERTNGSLATINGNLVFVYYSAGNWEDGEYYEITILDSLSPDRKTNAKNNIAVKGKLEDVIPVVMDKIGDEAGKGYDVVLGKPLREMIHKCLSDEKPKISVNGKCVEFGRGKYNRSHTDVRSFKEYLDGKQAWGYTMSDSTYYREEYPHKWSMGDMYEWTEDEIVEHVAKELEDYVKEIGDGFVIKRDAYRERREREKNKPINSVWYCYEPVDGEIRWNYRTKNRGQGEDLSREKICDIFGISEEQLLKVEYLVRVDEYYFSADSSKMLRAVAPKFHGIGWLSKDTVQEILKDPDYENFKVGSSKVDDPMNKNIYFEYEYDGTTVKWTYPDKREGAKRDMTEEEVLVELDISEGDFILTRLMLRDYERKRNPKAKIQRGEGCLYKAMVEVYMDRIPLVMERVRKEMKNKSK